MLLRAAVIACSALLVFASPGQVAALPPSALVELLLTGVDDGVAAPPGGLVRAGQWSWLDVTVRDLQGTTVADAYLLVDIRAGATSTLASGVTDGDGRLRVLVPAADAGAIIVHAQTDAADARAAWPVGEPLENATRAVWVRPQDAWTSVEVALIEPAIVSLVLHGDGERPREEASAGLYDLLFDLDPQNWSRWAGHGVSARSKDLSVRATSGTMAVALADDLPVALGRTELSWGIHHNGPLPAGTPIKLLLARAGLTGSDALAVRVFIPPGAGSVHVVDEGTFRVGATEVNGTGLSTTDVAAGPLWIGPPGLHRGSLQVGIDAPTDSLVLVGAVSPHDGGGAFTLTRDGETVLHREPPAAPGPGDGILEVGAGQCGGAWHATVDMPKFGSLPTLVLAVGDSMPLRDGWASDLRPDCAFGAGLS